MHHSIENPPSCHPRANRSTNQSLAYRGASLAFSPRLELPKPLITAHGSTNGAFATASFANTGEQMAGKASNEKRQMWKDSALPNIAEKSLAVQVHSKNSSGNLTKKDPSKTVTLVRGQSPSHIAALLAVTKSSPIHHDANVSRPVSGRSVTPQYVESDPPPAIWFADESPIPATNELVKLFESQIESQNPKHFKPSTAITASSISKHSEKVVNTQLAKVSPNHHLPQLSGSNERMATLPALQRAGLERSKSNPIEGSVSSTLSSRSIDKFVLVREKTSQPLDFRNKLVGDSSESSYSSALDRIQSPGFDKFLSPISSIKASKAIHLLAPTNQFVATNNPHFTSSSAAKNRGNDDFARAGTRLNSEGVLLPHSLTPQLTANSLANAMVASSLASSRAQSPSRPTHPPLRRQSISHLLFHRSHSQELLGTRASSPIKATMRQTMREALKSDDESERIKKSRYMSKKHPNKHYESDRKQLRDQITEQERKRYEGVWAANKGLFMPSQDMSSDYTVINLVVRDIWLRSRLSNEALQDIWDLVDNEAVGRLAKDEFVVGMWLIDQRLKGRKLPTKVPESVWSSARRLSGIKAPKKR